MKRFDKNEVSVQILITVIVFFILLSSAVIAIGAIVVVNMINDELFSTTAPITLIALALIISTIIGTAIGLFASRHYFKPVDKLIRSQKKVAKGDFSVRIPVSDDENLISELVNSFNTMVEELGSTEMFRNDFINNFSHEFKTPIVSIRGFAKQLQNDDLSEEQKREYINIIVNESDRLASMSSNILLLTKFENQQMVTDKTEFYLDEQIRKCILLLEKDWSRKNIDLDLDLNEISYYSNEEMLSHVWLNILSNAIKFTPENGTVTVKCYRDSSNITVKIIDNGIGMDDKTQRHIFDKFFQGDASHTIVGNGLGLPLAKRVVTLCGGKISVKSQTGKGTTFIVRLPVENENIN